MKRLCLLGLLTILAACSSTKETKTLTERENDPLLMKIREGVELIAEHSSELHAIEQARLFKAGKSTQQPDFSYTPGLLLSISLSSDYHGPLDKIVEELSLYAGLNKPRFLRVRPTGGVIVSLDTSHRTIADMLFDIQAQAGTRANLTLKVKEKLFEVEYLAL